MGGSKQNWETDFFCYWEEAVRWLPTILDYNLVVHLSNR